MRMHKMPVPTKTTNTGPPTGPPEQDSSAQVEACAAKLKKRRLTPQEALEFANANAHSVSKGQLDRIGSCERPNDQHIVRMINRMRTNTVRARDGLKPKPAPGRNIYFPGPDHTTLNNKDLHHFLYLTSLGIASAVAQMMPRPHLPPDSHHRTLQEIMATSPTPNSSANRTQGSNIMKRYRQRQRSLENQDRYETAATAGANRPLTP